MDLRNSLVKRILFFITLFTISYLIFNTFALQLGANKALMESEKEKAQLIVKTIKPLVEIDLFLNLEQQLRKLLENLMQNENVLEIAIYDKSGKLLHRRMQKKSTKADFVIKEPLFYPNSSKQIGYLVLSYSSNHFKELQRTLNQTTWIFALIFFVLYLLFFVYLTKLFRPLRKIAKQLREFQIEKRLQFGSYGKKDEIGLIIHALHKMQERIFEYKKEQENINKLLENEVKKKTAELRYRLYYDALTNLPNRLTLLEDVKGKRDGTLLLINVDDFKQINDIFGQDVGDEVLKELAVTLKSFADGHGGSVFRLGSDEFVLLFDEVLDQIRIDAFIQKLMYQIENLRFYHQEIPLNLRVTVGVSTSLERALEKADMALKKAKQLRKPYVLFSDDLTTKREFEQNITMVEVLKRAVEKGSVVPYFQPIVDAKSFQIVGYECLMRIRDEKGNILTPFHFLDVAKKSRYYPRLTQQMFQKCCRYFQDKPYRFSLNLSIEDILNDETVASLAQIIDETNVAQRVVLEIVESEGIENFPKVAAFIQQMKQKGALIVIDDFGSGYSNFEYLARLDIDYIKIDGSLIKEMQQNKNVKVVVEVIVDYVQRSGLKSVAEFVSTREIAQTLQKMGIDYLQGYYFGEPRPEIQ